MNRSWNWNHSIVRIWPVCPLTTGSSPSVLPTTAFCLHLQKHYEIMKRKDSQPQQAHQLSQQSALNLETLRLLAVRVHHRQRHTRTGAHTHIHTHTHIYIHTHTHYTTHTHTHTHTHTTPHTHKFTLTHTHTHTHTRARARARPRTHRHTHTPSSITCAVFLEKNNNPKQRSTS